MDIIREHLVYKDVPLTICMKELKIVDQYECIRLLLATRTKDVSVCIHDSTPPQVQKLLKVIGVQFVDCLVQKRVVQEFPLQISVEKDKLPQPPTNLPK